MSYARWSAACPYYIYSRFLPNGDVGSLEERLLEIDTNFAGDYTIRIEDIRRACSSPDGLGSLLAGTPPAAPEILTEAILQWLFELAFNPDDEDGDVLPAERQVALGVMAQFCAVFKLDPSVVTESSRIAMRSHWRECDEAEKLRQKMKAIAKAEGVTEADIEEVRRLIRLEKDDDIKRLFVAARGNVGAPQRKS